MPWQVVPNPQRQWDSNHVKSQEKICNGSSGLVNSNQSRGKSGANSAPDRIDAAAGEVEGKPRLIER
ncbi:hypothetical protein GCM10025785_20500 [Corynebacterium canis]